MASVHLCQLHRILTRVSGATTARLPQICLLPVRQKSTDVDPSPLGPTCKVDVVATSDAKTIVCYHPAADIPYEFTLPISRPDPVSNTMETHEQVLKSHLSREQVMKDKPGPTIEELSKMFFTTKHRWYPRGQYHMRRVKKNPPKDR